MPPPGSARQTSERKTRIDQAYTHLRSLIVAGRLSPGNRVVETTVARRLGISRTPVRSAIHRLQREGYLVAEEGGQLARLVVAPLTMQDARDLFEVLGGIEGIAARRAATLDISARRSIAEVLRGIDHQLLEIAAKRPPEPTRAYELFTQFHRHYVTVAGGARLRALHEAVKPQADRYRRLYSAALMDAVPLSVEEHTDIIRAIEDGDRDAAQRAVEVNWRNAADRMVDVIDALGERGSW
jgi:DNA-binding GntR family transcriptional regulator